MVTLVVGTKKKKTVKIDFYVADLPILETLLGEVEYQNTAEAIHFLFNIMSHMTDQINELQAKKCGCIEGKTEAWHQGRMRSEMPFYG